MATASKRLNVLMCGTGEYTTGWTGSGASTSDKKVGVVGLTLFDLRRLGKVDKLSMVGVNGKKFPQIREHLQDKIGNVYKDMDVSFTSYPDDNTVDPEAYKKAIDDLAPGSAVIIFTPDTTHYPIAKYALEKKMHVLVTKPATKLLTHHQDLIKLAEQNEVACWVEHHKRYDPAYADAKLRARGMGEFNFFSAWMSQPKSQLETFRAWAGKDSDISYYLSSHHIDIHCWYVEGISVPTRVVASAATGIATGDPYQCVEQTEDTITLLVDWQSTKSPKHKGTAVYTASWTAPLKAGVHSAQYFHYMGERGDIRIDQAHRGYDVTEDSSGKSSYNPFYMKYSPSETGHFDGQRGYGYISIDKFIDASRNINAGNAKAADFDKQGLPTIRNTVLTTAILNAGRISLDEKRAVFIEREGNDWKLEIKSSFKGTFLSADEEGYDISKWAENSIRPAKYVATALCVEDIVQSVKASAQMITFARANGLPLAIRGGGHKTSDSSASDGGVLIDLRRMNEVRVDQDARVAYVQGGTTVRQLDEETIKYGLATANGNCSPVGVIGFAIGGGISILTGEHGLGVDNIVSATVVLSNGNVVQANENENPDLFWGIRGGGSNFGVVAELGLRLYPQRKDVYMCQYVFQREQLPALVNAANEWRKTQKPYQGFYLLILLGPDGNPYVVFEGFSNSDQEEGEQSFKPILDLGPVQVKHGPTPYEDTCKGSDEFSGTPGNKVFVGADIDVFDVATLEKVYDTWLEVTKSGAPGSIIIYEFHSFEKVANVPVEATAFAQRHP
ncbi:hypothetical protein FRB99_000795, partial [Tulasnella sp. 403]